MNVYVLLKDNANNNLSEWNPSNLIDVFTNKKAAISNLYADIEIYKKLGWKVVSDEEVGKIRYIILKKYKDKITLKVGFRLIKIIATKYLHDLPNLPY